MNSDEVLMMMKTYIDFLGWNKDKISPHPFEKALLSLTETRDKGEKKG